LRSAIDAGIALLKAAGNALRLAAPGFGGAGEAEIRASALFFLAAGTV